MGSMTITLKAASGRALTFALNEELGLVVSGSSQEVCIEYALPGSMDPEAGLQRLLDAWARQVAKKNPQRSYTVRRITHGRRNGRTYKKETLFFWHVGDGFTHAEGWWCNAECED